MTAAMETVGPAAITLDLDSGGAFYETHEGTVHISSTIALRRLKTDAIFKWRLSASSGR